MQNDQKQIASAIIVAGVLIAGAILLKGQTSGVVAPRANAPELTSIKMRPVSADEHILGNPNAKVVIIEYSDTECPFCKVFHNTLHTTLDQNSDVAWVFRHFPIGSLHPKAFHEAEATECAWEQGGNDAFWKYLDEVFARTQSNNKLDVAELPKIASDMGLDVEAFNTCLESGKFAGKIEADMADGKAAGTTGTPYSLILRKGKVVDVIKGAQPLEQVTAKIQAALK